MQNCRLCKADADFQSIRAPFVFGGKDEHNFWSCEECDAIYLYPIPSPEEEKKFYLQEFEKFMSSRVGDHRDWSNAEKHKKTNQDQVYRRLPFFKNYLKNNLDLLEIGCSSGFMLDAFKDKGLNCIGVEPSGEFKDFLIQSGHNVVQDISEIEEHKKFDIITHFFVLEHIRDPFAFLSQSYDLLKENGVIICEIPCANDPLTSIYNIDAFEKFYWSIAHHYYYTPTSIKYVLNSLKYKFEIVPEQRYDISNHMTWMMEGKPGGQNKFFKEFGLELDQTYRQRLKDTWQCDTIFLYIWKK
jgi:SAM-dependent methyltransferase